MIVICRPRLARTPTSSGRRKHSLPQPACAAEPTGNWARVSGSLGAGAVGIITWVAKLTGQQIRNLARSIIAKNPGGIRYSALVDEIWQQTPETPKNTVHGSVWNLEALFPNEIAKPS